MESFDKEIEWAMIKGLDPAEHIFELLVDRAVNDAMLALLGVEKQDTERLLDTFNHATEPVPLTEEQFKQLLAAAYSTLLVSTRK